MLSKEQIEAFLERKKERAGSGEKGRNAPVADAKEITPFDPRKPNRLTLNQMDSINGFFEMMSEDLAKRFTGVLNQDVGIEVQSVFQERYTAFMESLSNPSCIFSVGFEPMKEPALMVFDHRLVFWMVDRVLGGSGKVEIDPRELTQVEWGITDQMAGAVIEYVAVAWESVVKLTPKLLDRTSDPKRVEAANPKDVLLVVPLVFSGTGKEEEEEKNQGYGSLTVCFPFASLEKYIGRIGGLEERDGQDPGKLEEWKGHLEKKLFKVEVGLPLVLGEAEISVGDFLNLKLEDVIVMDKKINDTVEMPIGSDAIIKGNVGMYNKRLAMKVLEIRKSEHCAGNEKEAANG